jgi:hypothetical protein
MVFPRLDAIIRFASINRQAVLPHATRFDIIAWGTRRCLRYHFEWRENGS